MPAPLTAVRTRSPPTPRMLLSRKTLRLSTECLGSTELGYCRRLQIKPKLSTNTSLMHLDVRDVFDLFDFWDGRDGPHRCASRLVTSSDVSSSTQQMTWSNPGRHPEAWSVCGYQPSP
ncbi:hypothetical protein RRG08_008372 [Elysia crispata]|uniref:Uncharacterized protein n=1 Tax=Elysia crispata TaxID=231223 RepID=A0AAE1E7H2_9GAST|nr:hypothetical protein RRG08_008372 [Elysia crispata]